MFPWESLFKFILLEEQWECYKWRLRLQIPTSYPCIKSVFTSTIPSLETIECKIFRTKLIFINWTNPKPLTLKIINVGWSFFGKKNIAVGGRGEVTLFQYILHLIVGTKFQLKLIILIFWTKSTQKGYFQPKMEKVNSTVEFCIFKLGIKFQL